MEFKGDLFDSIKRRSDSSESEGTCANAFKSASETFDFVCYVIFFVLSLLVIGAQVYLRKRYNNPTTRKLLGPFYAAAVGCIAIGWLLQIINMLFIQCSASYGGYYIQTVVSLLIAFVVFYRIGSYLLLVVAIWGVTSVLGDRLGREGKSSSHKMSSFIIVGCVGLLALVVIIVESVYYSFLPDGSITAMVYFNLGLHILRIIFSASWNLSILISLCLSIHSLSAIKSRFGISTKGLMIWVIIVYFSLGFAAILDMVPIAKFLQHSGALIEPGQQALFFLATLSQTFSFVAVALLAIKCPWDSASGSAVGKIGGSYIPVDDIEYNSRAASPEQHRR